LARGTYSIQTGEWQSLATAAKWTHIAGSVALLLALAGHVGVVLRHQLLRMLPGNRLGWD
jgi:hypothetical protein